MLRFPLQFKFPLITFAPSLAVTDAGGAQVCYVQQKVFRLKEAVTVYRDSSKTAILGSIEADRIIDWSARYTFRDPAREAFGAVGRRGARSIWRAHYDIFARAEATEPAMSIQEENPFAKVFDSVVNSIPLLGLFSGYLFHPTYAVRTSDGVIVARLSKQSAFLEGLFSLEKLAELDDEQELEILLSCLMMLLLERHRG